MARIRRRRLAVTVSRATSLRVSRRCTRHRVRVPTRGDILTAVYEHVGGKHSLEWASTLLGFIAILVTTPIYVFYWYGLEIRERSKFAQSLDTDRRKTNLERRASNIGEKQESKHVERV